MLLNDSGKAIWSKDLPEDIPLSYTASDVASFSKWYLNDYPVHVGDHENGLFVLGNSKNNTWKQQLEAPEKVMKNIIQWLLFGLAINFIVAILLAFLFGVRFFYSLRTIVSGINDMAEKSQFILIAKGF